MLAQCTRQPALSPYVIATRVDPASPVVGQPATIIVIVTDRRTGRPQAGAAVHVDAHMSHPGMAPVIADAVEQPAGAYRASLVLSMAGGWDARVVATMPDGDRVQQDTKLAVVP
jgi:hypothetical protein